MPQASRLALRKPVPEVAEEAAAGRNCVSIEREAKQRRKGACNSR